MGRRGKRSTVFHLLRTDCSTQYPGCGHAFVINPLIIRRGGQSPFHRGGIPAFGVEDIRGIGHEGVYRRQYGLSALYALTQEGLHPIWQGGIKRQYHCGERGGRGNIHFHAHFAFAHLNRLITWLGLILMTALGGSEIEPREIKRVCSGFDIGRRHPYAHLKEVATGF